MMNFRFAVGKPYQTTRVDDLNYFMCPVHVERKVDDKWEFYDFAFEVAIDEACYGSYTDERVRDRASEIVRLINHSLEKNSLHGEMIMLPIFSDQQHDQMKIRAHRASQKTEARND